jgi:hypothetical protein
MEKYHATNLKDLKQVNSGIHVTVEAMPLSGRSDGNGGFICSLAREGVIMPALVDNKTYVNLLKREGIYEIAGKWTGTQLEVHGAEMTAEFPAVKDHKPKTIYRIDSLNPSLNYKKEKKFKPQ